MVISDAGRDRATSSASALLQGKKVHWKSIGDRDLDIGNGEGDCRLWYSLRLAMRDMDGSELLAQLDEIDASGRKSSSLDALESLLLSFLAEKSPELLLGRFGSGGASDRFGFYYANAFHSYFEQDSNAAVAWLDKAIADGAFDQGKMLAGRMNFEVLLIQDWMKKDPEAAKARLSGLPDGGNVSLFGVLQAEPGTEATWADVIRSSLPEAEVARTLARVTISSSTDRLDEVDRLMASLSPTDKERDAMVSLTLQRHPLDSSTTAFSADRLDEARTWAEGISPAIVDRETGAFLGTHLNEISFEDVSQLIQKYAAEGDGDAMLTAFLKSPVTRQDPEQALPFCDQVSDPTLREQLRQQLQEIRARREAAPGSASLDPFAESP